MRVEPADQPAQQGIGIAEASPSTNRVVVVERPDCNMAASGVTPLATHQAVVVSQYWRKRGRLPG